MNIYHIIDKLLPKSITTILRHCKFKLDSKKFENKIKINNSRIFFLGAADHRNLGDHAQTYCIQEWLRKNYQEYSIITCTLSELKAGFYKKLDILKKELRIDDKIVLQSGYCTTDIYMASETFHRELINRFPNCPILFFPQTVKFVSPTERQISTEVYGKNPNLIFISRDDVSHGTAMEMFPKAKHLVYPDMVTSLIGNLKLPQVDRKGITLCMRNDREAFHLIESIKTAVVSASEGEPLDINDTTISTPGRIIQKDRKKFVLDMIYKFAEKKVIVTDRYHGVIFGLAANTPVIMLGTNDHKLTAGLKWFPKSFENHLSYARQIEQLPTLVNAALNCVTDSGLPPYFKTRYFDRLKDDIHLLSGNF